MSSVFYAQRRTTKSVSIKLSRARSSAFYPIIIAPIAQHGFLFTGVERQRWLRPFLSACFHLRGSIAAESPHLPIVLVQRQASISPRQREFQCRACSGRVRIWSFSMLRRRQPRSLTRRALPGVVGGRLQPSPSPKSWARAQSFRSVFEVRF